MRPLELRWTEHAIQQLSTIADHISLASPIYAEQMIERIARRLDQACRFPESGRVVPELHQPNVRELFELPYRLIYRMRHDRIEVISILHGHQDLRTPHGPPDRDHTG
jgi:toxin ParE1/3/4